MGKNQCKKNKPCDPCFHCSRTKTYNYSQCFEQKKYEIVETLSLYGNICSQILLPDKSPQCYKRTKDERTINTKYDQGPNRCQSDLPIPAFELCSNCCICIDGEYVDSSLLDTNPTCSSVQMRRNPAVRRCFIAINTLS